MTKGGYQILNFSNYKFSKDTMHIIKDIYEKINGTKKVILVSGLTVDGKEYRDAFVDFDFDAISGNFIGNMYDISIAIGKHTSGRDKIIIYNIEGV